jgi:hypothetical protein
LDETLTLKVSATAHPDLATGKWAALTVSSSGATTEIRVNGQLLTTVTEPQTQVGAPFARHGAIALTVSVPERAECGFDLDYLVVWKLPAPKK